MSVVVNLNVYKNKGTLVTVRELLALAARGRIAGLRFEVELTNGARKQGTTGKFAAPEPACNGNGPALIPLPVRITTK